MKTNQYQDDGYYEDRAKKSKGRSKWKRHLSESKRRFNQRHHDSAAAQDAYRQGVLDGKPDLVKNLDLQVGDLQLFKGRYSLHRVNQIGKGARHTVIFGYARQPNFIGSVASTMKVYGRVMQQHIDAEHTRQTDGLAD